MIHVLGIIGSVLVLGAYFLVSAGRIPSASYAFQGMNVGGALCLTAYALLLGGWPLVALNGIWAVIGLVAVARMALGKSARA